MLRLVLALVALAWVCPQAAHAQSGSPGPGSTRQTAGQVASSGIQPGTYALEITFGGGTLDAILEIAMVGDSVSAKLHLGEHDSPIKRVVRNGAHLSLSGGAEGIQVAYELDFDGDAVTGKFTYNGEAGLVAGKRRS